MKIPFYLISLSFLLFDPSSGKKDEGDVRSYSDVMVAEAGVKDGVPEGISATPGGGGGAKVRKLPSAKEEPDISDGSSSRTIVGGNDVGNESDGGNEGVKNNNRNNNAGKSRASSSFKTFNVSTNGTSAPISDAISKNRPERRRLKWLTEIFAQAERDFEMDAKTSRQCERDWQTYRRNLMNQTVWAVKMFEANEWPTVGIYAGQNHHFGNFDECVLSQAYDIRGRYCLAQADFEFKFHVETPENAIRPSLEWSVWKAIKLLESNPAAVNRRRQRWAICMPSSCTPTDLQLSLNNTLAPIFAANQMSLNVSVDPIFCHAKEETTYPKSFFVTCSVLSSILAVVLICTGIDIYIYYKKKTTKNEKNETLIFKIIYAISMKKNTKRLLKQGANEIRTLNFVKVFQLQLIIYGHRFIHYGGYPMTNTIRVEEGYDDLHLELIHANVVDVFFMASGFLTFYYGYLPMKKGAPLYFPLSILMRWIRMVPVFMVLMTYIIYIMPYTSDGVFWRQRVGLEAGNCRETWWTHLLVATNFVNVDKQCLVVSWYISTDIQLCILGTILLFIVTRNFKYGVFAAIFTFLTSFAITFAIAYANRYDGLLKLYINLLWNPRNHEQFTSFYILPYVRVGPYLVGFIAAIITKVMKDKGYKLNTKQKHVSFLVAVVLGEGCQCYGLLFYDRFRRYYPVENAFYAATTRVAYVIPMAWVVSMSLTSGIGIWQKFSDPKFITVLSRLSYSVFLVNTVLQLHHAASQQWLFHEPHLLNLVWLVAGDIILSYIFGFFLYLYMEAPLGGLCKIAQIALTTSFIRKKGIEIPAMAKATDEMRGQVDNEAVKRCQGWNDVQMMEPPMTDYSNKSYVDDERL